MKRELTQRQHEDVAFLSHPDLWPNWPLCPVKRYEDHMMHSAFVVFNPRPEGTQFTLLHANMFAGPQAIENAEREHFKNAFDIVAAGWEVD